MILVLGDLHIGIGREEKLSKLNLIFENFKELDAVIFLGDIFDFYFECPEKVEEVYGYYLSVFKQLAGTTTVFYIQGNHDFFPMHKLEQIGVKIISRDLIMERRGKSIFFTHGDLLSFKGRVTRSFISLPLWQSLMKLLPCNLIYAIARKISEWSRRRSSARPLKRENFKKIEELLSNFDIVITAHFHKPIINRYGNKIYGNPGDWLRYFTFLTLNGEFLTLWGFDNSLIVKLEEVKI
ncbi:MAG: UDP-2,3-diacylglucosamine diphosphatase [bacterium]|nr:UDP-2,3-diacylglucosamine diphosphatase [bacterium]